MSAAGEPLLDAEHAAFIQTGVSVVVAARDTGNVPRLARALGCRVSDDRRRVTVYLGAFQAAALLAAIRAEGAIAVAFNLPSTHRAFQLKGTDATACRSTTPTSRTPGATSTPSPPTSGCSATRTRTDVRCCGSIRPSSPAVTFTPTAAFEQTPGPRAGVPLGS